MAKRAVLPVSMDMIHALLRLPDDVQILHSTVGNFGLTLELVITAPDMAEADSLMHLPHATVNWLCEGDTTYLASVAYPSEKPAGGAE